MRYSGYIKSNPISPYCKYENQHSLQPLNDYKEHGPYKNEVQQKQENLKTEKHNNLNVIQ